MNRLIVNPTPHRMAAPPICGQLSAGGRDARPVRSASQIAPNTPIGLPTSRPSATPSGKAATSSISAGQRDARAGQPEQRHDAEHDDFVEVILEPLDRRAAVGGAQRDGQRGEHPGDGGVDPRFMDRDPQQDEAGEIGPQAAARRSG